MIMPLNKITFSRTAGDDVDELIMNIRPEDKREVEMEGVFSSIEEAVKTSVAISQSAYSMKASGKLLIIYGAAQGCEDNNSMVIWGLGTKEVDKHKRQFLRATRDGVQIIMDEYPNADYFYNAMPEIYPTYRKWAEKYMNATFMDEPFVSPGGHAFRAFIITNQKGVK